MKYIKRRVFLRKEEYKIIDLMANDKLLLKQSKH